MISVLIAGGVAMVVALLGTPLFINFLVSKQYGQFIRQDGPTAHYTKRGTPTMGGVVIIAATLLGWAVAAVATGNLPSASAVLVLFLMTGLGVVGFLDDFIKISRQRSLGLSARWKIVGQGFVGITFAVLALQFPDATARTPASTSISFIRDTNLDLAFAGATLGAILFVVWANFLITAWSNAVNLTDGLDGLATGASLIVFGSYVIVCVWQFNQRCALTGGARCYDTRDPLDMAVVAAAITGACFGFLWWNASPAKIFMGDTGSLALGGALAGLSIVTRTEVLAAIIGGLFVIIVMSDVIQIGFFKLTGRRVFKMAPLHHHFELSGWGEVTIVIRFWLIAGLFVSLGVGIFYAEWVAG
ncbi:phospho-N-acetylmuramoyl-pentapeptide-transferase [Cellulomonas endometrii]|uniref:phospho-N-acetylmuramoyl-pentapeptide- transferase n=1 Tax=Cellulomonas endometrii TaxID=3036301 RepID=UPI0024ACB98E|nr:phospho-N-acetylmuramoyl-pentapeptide-transferase [Cellulomonas endometrii]